MQRPGIASLWRSRLLGGSGEAADGYGGAIYNLPAGQLSISSSNFSDNQAMRGSNNGVRGAIGGSADSGGYPNNQGQTPPLKAPGASTGGGDGGNGVKGFGGAIDNAGTGSQSSLTFSAGPGANHASVSAGGTGGAAGQQPGGSPGLAGTPGTAGTVAHGDDIDGNLSTAPRGQHRSARRPGWL